MSPSSSSPVGAANCLGASNQSRLHPRAPQLSLNLLPLCQSANSSPKVDTRLRPSVPATQTQPGETSLAIKTLHKQCGT